LATSEVASTNEPTSAPLDAPSEAKAPRFFYGYYLVGAAFVAQLVSIGMSTYVLGPFLKPMTDELLWTRSEFTLARTVGQCVMALTGFFIGTHVDKHGGRRLMMIGIAILTSALFAMSFVQELWHWVVLNGLALTVGAALIGNLVVNVTLAKWFVERRGWAASMASMGVSTAGITLAPLTTLAIDEVGWRTAWRLLAGVAALLIVPTSLVMRRAPEDYGLFPDGKTKEQIAAGGGQRAITDYDTSLTRKQALRTVSFYMLVLAFGMFAITIGVMLLQTIPFMTDAGYSRGRASFMVTLASIPALLSKPVWGRLIDTGDPKKMASMGAALTGTAMVVITFAVKNAFDPMVYFGFFLLGFGWGGLIPLQEVIWAVFFGRRYLGSVRSAALPFSLLIGAGGPLLVSFYFDTVGNYNGAFLGVAALNLTSAVLLLFVPRPLRVAQ